jgi:hypothetical protein
LPPAKRSKKATLEEKKASSEKKDSEERKPQSELQEQTQQAGEEQSSKEQPEESSEPSQKQIDQTPSLQEQEHAVRALHNERTGGGDVHAGELAAQREEHNRRTAGVSD